LIKKIHLHKTLYRPSRGKRIPCFQYDQEIRYTANKILVSRKIIRLALQRARRYMENIWREMKRTKGER
jgi:hypothetical protein